VTDPWTVLGLAPGASIVEARAARRRLAKQLHPDMHVAVSPAERVELARRMVLVNLALAEVEAAASEAAGVSRPGSTTHRPDVPRPGRTSRRAGAAAPPPSRSTRSGAPTPTPSRPGPPDPSPPAPRRRSGHLDDETDHPYAPAAPLDTDSFSVAALPAEAFEALFLVAYGIGDILVAEEPYTMELYLSEPASCFCQLSLVPEAGGSIVTIDLTPAEATDPPPAESVRDLLVSELNDLAGTATA
jgi:hypothetical protein